MPRRERRLVARAVHAQWLLWLCLGLIAASCAHGQAKPMKKYYPPTEFFSGRELELARAIEREDLPEIRLLAQGVDLDAKAGKDMTLLIYAMMNDKFAAISQLVRLGAKPDENIIEGIGTSLDYALYNQDLRYLTALLDGGLSPDHKSPKHKQMLQRAAGPGGSLAHVKLLVDRGANLNVRDSIGGTALSEAVSTLKPDIALYLVERGADISTNTVNGVTVPWSVLGTINRQQPGPMRSKFEQLRDLMIQKGAKWPPDPPEVVRDRMRAQGLKPAVPPGKAK